MRPLLLTWIGTAVALLITANIVPGFSVKNFVAALVAAIIIGLVNAIIRLILSVLTFPITLLTFWLFTFVINALALRIATALTPRELFDISGVGAALLGSIVLALVSSTINYFLRKID
ncbi:phage holin family protein [Mastigocladopsis repens]|uniref:phage holin family protein n=1 Tax=Mastigocladopsis repens TaxID=221287 RepID=UPI00036D62B0|nr:phage holin family protein [Mastigocladopsis repens]